MESSQARINVARIFLGIAVIAVLLLIMSVIIGYRVDDFSGKVQQYRDLNAIVKTIEREISGESEVAPVDQRRLDAARNDSKRASEGLETAKNQRTFHTLVGIAAAMLTVFVSSIAVTYFVGTSRWCKEVVEAYHLDPAFVERSKAFKRGAFPWALGSMLAVVLISLSGPFADIASSAHYSVKSTPLANVSIPAWISLHAWSSIVATVFVAICFFAQLAKIAGNYVVIDEVLERVRTIRKEKGLDQPAVRENRPAVDPTDTD